MKQAQAVKVQGVIVAIGFFKQLQRAFQRVQQIGAAIGHVRHVQRPARVMRHVVRIPPAVCVGLDGRLAGLRRVATRAPRALQVAANPALLKPGDMAQFPQRRVERGEQRYGKTGFLQRVLVLPKKVQRMIARVHQRERQEFPVRLAHEG